MREKLNRLRMRIAVFFVAIAVAATGLVTLGVAPAFAYGQGTMCMFDAPNGAPIGPGYAAGHVGWGFETSSSGQWTFGSTEIGDGHPTSTWILSGSTAHMLAVFKAYKGGAYYQKWRCHATPESSVGAATTRAFATKNNGYNPFWNNCLTKAIWIYNAYYVDPIWGNMGAGWGVPPNNYFNDLGTDYGWGPVHIF